MYLQIRVLVFKKGFLYSCYRFLKLDIDLISGFLSYFMMSAPLIGHGQDTPDTFNRGSLGFNSDRVPSNYHSTNFIRRPNSNQSDSISSNGGRPPLNPVSEFTSLSRPDPKYADYSLKQKRVESYRNWPPSAKQKPENLVDAGFFYTGD